MILDRLCQIEESAKLKIKQEQEQERIQSARFLKALLKEVNLRAEIVPSDNEMQIIKLFQDLKGKDLDSNELLVVLEII